MGSGSITFDTLMGGVTQTPQSLRTGDKGSRQDNCISTLNEGLRRRPHTTHVGDLGGLPAGVPKFHFIDRGDERYVLAIGTPPQAEEGSLMAIFDVVQGASPVMVRDQNGDPAVAADFSYLDCEEPALDLKLKTNADVTWITNLTKNTAMEPTLSPSWTPELLYVVVTGGYTSTYSLTVEGRTVELTTNSAVIEGNEKFITPGYIAEKIAAGLTGLPSIENPINPSTSSPDATISPTGTPLLASEWEISHHGGVVHVRRADGAEFEASVEDSFTTRAVLVKDTVAAFTELPAVAPDGFNIKVDGDEDLEGGEYYLTFEADIAGDFGSGDWTQTVAPGVKVDIDPTTMPHILVRLSNGEFLFTPADGSDYDVAGVTFDIPKWESREVGDDTSNPEPSFIGGPVRDIVFFANRLAILSPQSVAMSTASEAYSFWRLTARQLLDSTRIDLTMPHNRVVDLHSAAAIGGQLYPLGDKTQFRIAGGSAITPSTVSSVAMSEYSTDGTVSAISVGTSIFAADRRGAFSVVREFVDPQQSVVPSLRDTGIMGDLPAFIVGQVREIAGSDTLSMLAVTSIGDPFAYYVLNLIEQDGQRIVGAWSRQTSTGEVMLTAFVGTDMFLLVRRDDVYSLEIMDMAPFAADEGRDYAIALDRRFEVTPTEKSGINTVVQVPYTIAGQLSAVTTEGETPEVVDQTATSITLRGDYTGEVLVVGERFLSAYEPSRAFLKLQSQTGGTRNVHAAWLVVSGGSVAVEDTGYLVVEVEEDGVAYREFLATERMGDSVAGDQRLISGDLPFDVMLDSSDYKITLLSDSYLPFRILSLKLDLAWRDGDRIL